MRAHRKAIEGLREDVDATLRRVDKAVGEAESLLRDEVAPTLQVARRTLQNIEVTTRALADTTIAARTVVGRIERSTNAARLGQVGGLATGLIMRKGSGAAAGLFSNVMTGVGHALLGLIQRRARGAAAGGRSSAPPRKAVKDTSGSSSEAVEVSK